MTTNYATRNGHPITCLCESCRALDRANGIDTDQLRGRVALKCGHTVTVFATLAHNNVLFCGECKRYQLVQKGN